MGATGVNASIMRSKQALEFEDDDVKARMLSAAEIVFAAKGHDKASLRELTGLANVNLAAVNYHFGSKDGLVSAVFERLSARVNRARLKELERYLKDRTSAEVRPVLADILAIFVRPYFEDGVGHQGVLLARLILQHRLSQSDLTNKIIRKHFDPMAKQFIRALGQACPGIDRAELHWRYMFMVSAVVLTITDTSKDGRVSRLSGGLVDASESGFMRDTLLRFLSGGVAAPGGTPKPNGEARESG